AFAKANLFADIEHRRLVAFTLTDNDGALDRQAVQLGAHRVHRCLIGIVLVAAPTQSRGCHRSPLCHANKFEREDTIETRLWAFRHKSHPFLRISRPVLRRVSFVVAKTASNGKAREHSATT